MNGMELAPSEPRHTITVPLSLDIDQRLNLLHELRGLSAELQENPFIQPDKSVIELKGISLRPPTKNGPTPYMSLKLSESDRGPSSASISLTGTSEQRTYIHRPSFNLWEEWHPGAPEALNLLGNSALIATLEPHVPDGTLESIMDSPSQGMEVATLLASALKKKARTRTEYRHYKAHDIQIGNTEFSRDTDFVIDTVNSRVAHNLFVASSFMIDDFGHIRKTYRYDAVDEHGYLKSAFGTLNVSSGTHVPKARLNAFGLRDPIRNDPSTGINIGVNDIRRTYTSS